MFEPGQAIDRAEKPRKPSCPTLTRLAYQLRLSNASESEMKLFEEVCDRIARNEIPYRPSVLEEFTRRALHGIGLSGMSDNEMRLFIAECQGNI